LATFVGFALLGALLASLGNAAETVVVQSGKVYVTAGGQTLPTTVNYCTDGNANLIPCTQSSGGGGALALESTQLSVLANTSSIDSKLNSLGQKAMSGSSPIVIASDQSAVPISAVSLPLPTNAASEPTVSSIDGKLNSLGQKPMSGSTPVTIASDQANLDVTSTVNSTPAIPTPTLSGEIVSGSFESMATYSSLTVGSYVDVPLVSGISGYFLTWSIDCSTPAFYEVIGVPNIDDPSVFADSFYFSRTVPKRAECVRVSLTNGTTAPTTFSLKTVFHRAPATTTTEIYAGQQRLEITPGGGARVNLRDNSGAEISPALESTQSSIDSKLNSLGQKAMAASTPVVIASDQSQVKVTLTDSGGSEMGDGVGDPVYTFPLAAVGGPALADKFPSSLGAKTMAGSFSIVLASNHDNIGVDAEIVTQPARSQATDSISTGQFNQSDTYTATGNGVTVTATTAPVKYYSVQVTGTGAAATAWDVRLECSLDNVGFTTVLTHTNVDGDTTMKASGSAGFPCLYFRSRTAGLTLGGATNIVVRILGVQ
jgi:hypothetical protein